MAFQHENVLHPCPDQIMKEKMLWEHTTVSLSDWSNKWDTHYFYYWIIDNKGQGYDRIRTNNHAQWDHLLPAIPNANKDTAGVRIQESNWILSISSAWLLELQVTQGVSINRHQKRLINKTQDWNCWLCADEDAEDEIWASIDLLHMQWGSCGD